MAPGGLGSRTASIKASRGAGEGMTLRARFEAVDWDGKGYLYRHELSAALRDDAALAAALGPAGGAGESARLQCEAVFAACGAERTLQWGDLEAAVGGAG